MNILGTLKSDIQQLIKLKLEHKECLVKLIYISDISNNNKYRNDNMSEYMNKRILDLHYQILNLEEKLGL